MTLMSDCLTQFFQELSNGSFDGLNLNLNVNGTYIARLQNRLQTYNKGNSAISDKQIEKLVESQQFAFHGQKEWTRFNMMVVSFLQLCRDLDPWSLGDSYDVLFDYYGSFVNCLLNDSYPIDRLVELVPSMTNFIIPVAAKLDENHLVMQTVKNQFLSHTSSIISKLFNSIKPSRIVDNEMPMDELNFDQLPKKQQILLYLVNKLNNIYFKIQSQQLCSNIFKNFKPKSMINKFSDYPINEQIEYRYLLGRYYMINNNIVNAFIQLDQAFALLADVIKYMNMNPTNMPPQFTANLKRILRYLLPAGLICNKLPNWNVVQQLSPVLAENYRTLSIAVGAGNLHSLNDWLQKHETNLRQHHLLLVLLEKLPILAYRNLMKLTVQNYTIPLNSSRLPYPVVEAAMKISIKQDPSQISKINIYESIHTSKNAENILVTLINLNLLRGNCFPMSKTCVIKKTSQISDVFPKVDEKIVSMFPLYGQDSWLDQ